MAWGVTKSPREPWAGAHDTGMHAAEGASAADMPAAGMSGEAAATHPAATPMATTTALRPHGHGQQ